MAEDRFKTIVVSLIPATAAALEICEIVLRADRANARAADEFDDLLGDRELMVAREFLEALAPRHHIRKMERSRRAASHRSLDLSARSGDERFDLLHLLVRDKDASDCASEI